MNGLIFFEDGTVVPFGQIQSAQRIAKAVQEIIPQLLKRERDQLLQTVSKDELKQIAERVATENDDNSNV